MADGYEQQRLELYVGRLRKDLWTTQSLCDYFHRIIPDSKIENCRFYSRENSLANDSAFAIITFSSVASVNQCLDKRIQFKAEHGLFIKRNLNVSKDQRHVTNHILINVDKYEPSFNEENVLTYFGKYGPICDWDIRDNNRTFRLTFEDFDSVDRIFLDQPHSIDGIYLNIRKCYEPNKCDIPNDSKNVLKEQIRHLNATIDESTDIHEYEIAKLEQDIEKVVNTEREHLKEITKSYIRTERLLRDLKQDFIHAENTNQHLKSKIEEITKNNESLVQKLLNDLECQRSTNRLLEKSISNKLN